MFVIRSHHGSQLGNFELFKMIQCSITMIVSMITCILDVWKGSLDVQSSRKERILWTVVSGRCMCKAATSLIVWKDRVMSTPEFRTVHTQSVALSITTANPNLNSYQPQEFRTFAHMQPSRSFNRNSECAPVPVPRNRMRIPHFAHMQSVALSITTASLSPHAIPTNRKNSALCTHAVNRSFNHNSECVPIPVPSNRKNSAL